MPNHRYAMIDGNEAAARIAYLTNEVIAIYPITPSSGMAELADAWAAGGSPNLWGSVPEVMEMQSEAGVAGAVHGALQTGALATTFTASQGLLLMIPNMYKIAGELTPAVFHVAARSLAAQALSIFGDHSDVMAARTTGFAMLASGSPQEAQDLALIAQCATLESRVPFIHFFDGFRTSHEINRVDLVDEETIRALLPESAVHAHRERGLSPDRPVVRGTAQNPDVYFQAREAANPYYARVPAIVDEIMARFADATGRRYRPFEYTGADDAERVVVVMGSGAETAEETARHLRAHGEKVGVVRVRLYRPFSAAHLLAALPAATRRIAVLDRTKEPGADGEPLYKDVATAVYHDAASGSDRFGALPRIIGGRYGLSSKEFTPGMVKAVFDELAADAPRHPFTVGIHDDVTGTSLTWDPAFRTDALKSVTSALFYGLGSDGTVSANHNSIRVIGEQAGLHAQGYFVYDSRKAGAVTVSHLRFGDQPIHAPYLVDDDEARFVACHQAEFLQRYEILRHAAPGATVLLNSPAPADRVWETLPLSFQRQAIDKGIDLYTIDAYTVARESGLGRRINTVMQVCFFALSGVLPRDEAIGHIKAAAEKSYARKGREVVEKNFAAIDAALDGLHRVPIPEAASAGFDLLPPVPDDAPAFVREVEGAIIAGHGDELPVSCFPVDGTFPVGTARYEKRALAREIPHWDEDLCTQCGKCPLVCPHSAIRGKVYPAEAETDAPASFRSAAVKGKEFPEGHRVVYQVAPEDCTGCNMCIEVCPAHDKQNPERKALAPVPLAEARDRERANWAFFLTLPEYDRTKIRWNTIRGATLGEPLFEFSSACVGCGETPYIRLATQLFGDRMLVANATGCSSIYGGNLPTTPWTANADGRGPAWSNSLFEDNAEFGLGFRLSIDKQRRYAEELLERLREPLGGELVDPLREGAADADEAGLRAQRERVAALKAQLAGLDHPDARHLAAVADHLVHRSVWLVGGDGWAFDIGFGGLDHVLATGRNVNILVLDTEVYSNTGGQTSKATPRGAVAKFSVAGKASAKKELALFAMAYENVYVAQVAFGARDKQTLNAFLEAEAHPGPSLIIAYSPCIAHGVDLASGCGLRQQELAVKSGHWPLLRHRPDRLAEGKNPLVLESKAPSIPLSEYMETEPRFHQLTRSHPETAEALNAAAQAEVDARYRRYRQLSELLNGEG